MSVPEHYVEVASGESATPRFRLSRRVRSTRGGEVFGLRLRMLARRPRACEIERHWIVLGTRVKPRKMTSAVCQRLQ